MVDFNGWDMPVEYPSVGGLMKEHLAVRNGVGVFDVSHMGDIRISGPQALEAVQHITMNDAAGMAIGQCRYSAMLYPEGTFVDDVIVHRMGEEDYMLVINAGTREKDVNWVTANTRQFDCKVENLSDNYTQIAIQGPKGVNTLQKLTDADCDSQVLLVHARDGMRTEEHSDCAHGIYGGGRLRNLRADRREDQCDGVERSAGSGQGIRYCALRTGRAQHAAAGRQAAALWA